MPWELGYFDGYASRAAILPIADETTNVFKGNEYLGLYPFMSVANSTKTGQSRLWITDPSDSHLYDTLDKWLERGTLSRHS